MEVSERTSERSSRPGFAWHGAGHVAYTAAWIGALAILFSVVYGGANLITGLHPLRVPVALPIERRIPMLPWTVVIYSSVYAMFAIVPFVLPTREEVAALGRAIEFEICVAGLCFLAIPAEPAYPATHVHGPWAGLFHAADAVNLTFNMAPSLHVAFAVACAAALGRRLGRAPRVVLAAWAAAVCLSTLTTHQHHVVDVLSGVLLARVALRRYGGKAGAADA